MMAIVHSNVGLMHATMAVFNAWCDRMPLLLFGATGPVDAAKRRPWIDWIHTSKDQGSLVRDYTKWDDQPLSRAPFEIHPARPPDRRDRAARPGLHLPRRRHAGDASRPAAAAVPISAAIAPPEPMAPAPQAVEDVASCCKAPSDR